MKALTLTTARRRKPTVILTGLNIAPSRSINLLAGVGKMVKAVFSSTGCLVALGAVALLMWVHIVAIDDTLELQRQTAIDALLYSPWALAYLLKGGRRLQAAREALRVTKEIIRTTPDDQLQSIYEDLKGGKIKN